MYCHPAYRVSSPPTTSPTVAPLAASAPQIPSALLRSAPSSNMFITIDSDADSITAAPIPCTARAPIRNPSPVASAQARGGTEHAEPRDQDPAAAEQIGGAPTQQQEAAEGERVRG